MARRRNKRSRLIAQVIHIPVSFEYRISAARWEAGRAVIRGWAKEPRGNVDWDCLRAEVMTSEGMRSFSWLLDSLPPEEKAACMRFAQDQDIDSDRYVAKICSSFHPMMLVCLENPRLANPEVENSSAADAWQLRQEFLATKLDRARAVAFLNKWGYWDDLGRIELSALIGFQAHLRKAMLGPADKWLMSHEATPNLWQRISKYPYFVIRTNLCSDAIRMAVTIDFLKESKFGICKRPDCGQPFPIRSKHIREYCKPSCGRRQRAREKRKRSRLLGTR
jgi:hypothetical protein